MVEFFTSNQTEKNKENLKACEIECGNAIREINQFPKEFLKKIGSSPLS